jgi:hypothetical protein
MFASVGVGLAALYDWIAFIYGQFYGYAAVGGLLLLLAAIAGANRGGNKPSAATTGPTPGIASNPRPVSKPAAPPTAVPTPAPVSGALLIFDANHWCFVIYSPSLSHRMC